MKSLLRFTLFLSILLAFLSAVYFWKVSSPSPAHSNSRAPSSASSASSAPSSPLTSRTSPPSSQSPKLAQAFPAPPIQPTSTAGLQIRSRLPMLEQLDREFRELVQQVRPSVVSITAENPMGVLARQPGGWGVLRLPPNLGSGAIVSEEGHVLTNLHVIQSASAVLVHLHDGRTVEAQLIGADPLTDIAILKIDAHGLKPLPFGNSDEVQPGQVVFAVGNPYGLQETVTQGIISGIGRRSTTETVNEFFQTDTAINPGNSGGPLLNIYGEMIGVNNAIHTRSGGWEGISFAIPSNTARRVYEDIVRYGRVKRTWFGVAWGRAITPQIARQLGLPGNYGVLIEYTFEKSPADEAGLRAGDVIVEFNGRRVEDGYDLRTRVAEMQVGDVVEITFYRRGRRMTTQVRLAELVQ